MISDSLALEAYSGLVIDSMIVGIKLNVAVGTDESLLVTSYIIKKKGWQEGIGNGKILAVQIGFGQTILPANLRVMVIV